jgi:ribosome biogenesis GTPase
MNIKTLGFTSWFQEKTDPAKLKDLKIARVVAVNKDSYLIKNDKTDIPAEIIGKLMFSAESPLDYPTVGDWIYAQYLNENTFAIIHEIFPRKSLLKRKTPGKRIEFQLIAANIDTALIMQSLDSNFNLRRMERYLVMANESHIHPVILLSKKDLLTTDEVKEKITGIRNVMPDIKVITFSNLDHSGLDKVKNLLTSGKTYCLLGSSGVGKTTLLNNLLDKELFETQPVREKDSRGRQTTTRRQLIQLKNGAIMIDTPGMRELGNISVESGIGETFDEIVELSLGCRFNDCSHIQEDGCAVLDALKNGNLARDRYNNYIKMKKESTYNKMSYLEKRKKDKQFGKMVKSVMKHHIKK